MNPAKQNNNPAVFAKGKRASYENTKTKMDALNSNGVLKPTYVNSDPAGLPAPILVPSESHVYEEIKNPSLLGTL